MNWKRGFRRILFVLAIFVAIVCASLSVVVVLLTHSDAQSNLRWEQEQSAKSGVFDPDAYLAKKLLEEKMRPNPSVSNQQQISPKTDRFGGTIIGESAVPITPEQAKQELQRRAAIQELQNGFWVNLSKGGLVGLCGAIGLVGGIIGFVIVWLIYKFFEWLVLGFCDSNRLPPEKT